ncbi:MAG: hypothetical protein RJQ10_16430 [Haliea sp.]|uniref:hypothetical protein n=1 Tax=Haliea sp. TaxID=1932666 RepID=UPI0032ED14C7
MGYHCRDCSYRGNKLTSAGSCPACGSYAIGLGTKGPRNEEPKPRKLQMTLLLALWAGFVGLLLYRFLS